MTIELLGDNCCRSQRLQNNIELALQSFAQNLVIQKVGDPERFASYGILSLPALMVDGEVMAAGQVLSVKEIIEML
jgi:predicted thioredoxin/glutaredoxin